MHVCGRLKLSLAVVYCFSSAACTAFMKRDAFSKCFELAFIRMTTKKTLPNECTARDNKKPLAQSWLRGILIVKQMLCNVVYSLFSSLGLKNLATQWAFCHPFRRRAAWGRAKEENRKAFPRKINDFHENGTRCTFICFLCSPERDNIISTVVGVQNIAAK